MIYIDSSIFLNAILYDDKKANKCKEIINKIAKGELSACTSLLSWDEVTYIIKKHKGKKEAEQEGEKFLKMPNLKFIGINMEVVLNSQEKFSKYNLDPRDSIHIATALISNAKKIASDDSNFDKVEEIERIKFN